MNDAKIPPGRNVPILYRDVKVGREVLFDQQMLSEDLEIFFLYNFHYGRDSIRLNLKKDVWKTNVKITKQRERKRDKRH